ncbi:S8 family peptidase [Neorhodopirellula pilleata]|uniref:Subtilisin BL n=1 Tax=Neorhodopirellula pilleata TaxID=2714738 RepID=A0A5C5ZKT1_9BACT|nr:S8 family serine peptidase [Neorhodopirellula pilleata]TWT87033.1 Subtilisin BL [Neorhodopirellula pilleata]
MSTLFTDLDASPVGIETCETRLALSASLMGAWLAPLADPLTDPWAEASPTCPAELHLPLEIPIQTGLHTDTAGSLDQAFAQAALNFDPSGNGSSLLEQAARVAAATGLDGAGQTIAVIDSGIAYDHHAFGENGRSGGFGPGYRVVGGWDFAENDADPYDDAPAGYHGSHVAGLTGGLTETIDGNTFRGVAPGADLVALRVFNDAGAGNLSWIEQSLRWVYDNQDSFEFPITTVNLSLGTELTDLNREYAYSLLEDELQLLYESDILVFAAAGNGQLNLSPGADDLMYPASSPWVSAVGSVDTNGNLSGFSQRADGMFVAEGQRLQSSVPEHIQGYDGYLNDYSSLSGTSMASPQVAAASALVRQAMQQAGLEATSESILQRLQDTSVQRVDPATGISYQSLDLEAAVDFGHLADPGEGENSTPSPSVPTPMPTIDRYEGSTDGDRLQIDLRAIVNGGDVLLSDNPLDPDSSTYRLIGSQSGDPIVIDAGSGSDTLQIFGSTGNEQLTLRPTTGANAGSSLLTFAGGTLELRGFENVTFIGEGGEDRATLYDSDGNDELRSGPDRAQLTGIGFEFHLEQVDKLYVYATAGGNDTAHLTDSIHDDQLVIRPQFSSLRGGDHFQAAFGFERVFAYAENGGHDRADLGDSAADDVMSISSTRSLISGSGYRASALGFESVQATASQGGDDTVRIYVDDPNGQWHTTESLTQWTGADGTSRIARGFERSEAFENFETVPVGSQALSQAPIATQAWRSITDIQRETDEHLRSLQQLFEELAE